MLLASLLAVHCNVLYRHLAQLTSVLIKYLVSLWYLLFVVRFDIGILALHGVQHVAQESDTVKLKEHREPLLGQKQKVDLVPRRPSRSRRRSQNATQSSSHFKARFLTV